MTSFFFRFCSILTAAAAVGGAASVGDCKDRLTLTERVAVPYGCVERYERADGSTLFLAKDKTGKLLSATEGGRAAAEKSLPSLTVTTGQTDVYGERVSVRAEEENGVLTLADTLRNIYVYDAKNGTGQLLTDDSLYRTDNGVFGDPIAITSYLNLTKVYDFYAGGGVGVPLRGPDGSHDEIAGNKEENGESGIRLLIHYGVREQNAHGWYDKWSNSAMIGVGDGDPDKTLSLLGRATDVVAHEYQHAITHLCVDFVQMNESGAIDEAISDILGALAEGYAPTDDRFWEMGEDAMNEGTKGVRSMKDPQGGYASSFDDPFPACHEHHNHNASGCDFGGVHYNSTILTHAQYLMWEEMPEVFSPARMGELWYSVIPLLSADADFPDFKAAFLQTAENLGFGEEALAVIRKHLGMTPSPAQYEVSFRNADGSLLYRTTVPEGGTAVYEGAPPALPPTAEQVFFFDGWDLPLENIGADTVFTAKYRQEPRPYSVRYHSDGLLYEETLFYGEAVPLRPPEERKGFTFGGWYLDEGFEKKADGAVVGGELDLYAKWEKKFGAGAAAALSVGLFALLSIPVCLLLYQRKKK